jgi:hypothetical protein
MKRWPLALLALVMAGAGAAHWRIAPKPNPAKQAADYRDMGNWVCRPGRADSCAADLAATAVAADGTTSVVASPPPAAAPIDCFYVYPTVSRDPHANAPLAMAPEIDEVARVQFARFRSVCRTYAPLYRQVTLRALVGTAIGIGAPADRALAYADVRAAWDDYLAHDNGGRGVVLIGHSQGARVIKALLQREIEGKPVQRLLVSALVLGNGVVVPKGRATGGDFKALPLCAKPTDTGCVISYASFRASVRPPAGAFRHFGIDPSIDDELACTNPAALAGGPAVLDAYFPEWNERAGRHWANPPVPIHTPFVTLPGLISGTCVHESGRSYLAITFNSQPGAPRTRDVGGDVKILGHVLPGWGLHLIDVNLTLGDLVRLVGRQAQAFAARR